MEGEVPGGRRELLVARIEPHGGAGGAVLHQLEAPVAFAQEAGLGRRIDTAHHEERLGIAAAEGLELVIVVEEFHGQLIKADFGIELEHGFEGRAAGLLPDLSGKGGAERLEVFLPQADAGGHVVSAAAGEEGAAGVERRHEGNARHTAAAALALAFPVYRDHKNRPVKLAHQAGGHDADHTGMPAARGDDKALGRLAGGHPLQGLGGGFGLDLLFQRLAFAVLDIEIAGDFRGFAGVFAKQQIQRGMGGVEPAGGVEAWSKAEAEVHAGVGFGDAGDLDQRPQASAAGGAEAVQALTDHESVFLHEGHDISHGGEGDEVQFRLEIKGGHLTLFQHGVGDLEDHAGAAEIMPAGAALGIHQRDHLRKPGRVGLVVIQDNHVNALGLQPSRFVLRGGATVHCDEQGNRPFREAAQEALPGEAITFLHAERQKTPGGQAIGLEQRVQQGQTGHAIHVVVAKEHHGFPGIHRLQQAGHGRLHVREGKRVAEFLQFGIEEPLGGLPSIDAALREQAAHQRGLAALIQRCQTIRLHRAQVPLGRHRHKMSKLRDSSPSRKCNPEGRFSG